MIKFKDLKEFNFMYIILMELINIYLPSKEFKFPCPVKHQKQTLVFSHKSNPSFCNTTTSILIICNNLYNSQPKSFLHCPKLHVHPTIVH